VEDSSPAVGDLDNDGDLEIVAATKGGYIYVWHHDGTIISGWPLKPSGTLGVNGPSPALGDLDGDGDLEIVLSLHSGGDDLYAWHHDGSLLYSKNMPSGSGNIISSPVLVDLDGDGLLETLIHDEYGPGGSRLSIIDSGGSVLNSVFFTASSSISTPAVGDIDGDGKPEIVVLSQGGSGKIHVFTVTDGSFDIESSPWPMYHRDARNTGIHSPLARIISPSNGSVFNPGENITFSGSGFSIDGSLDTFEWDYDGDGAYDDSSPLTNYSYSTPGYYTFVLKVVDSSGYSGIAKRTIRINSPPNPTIVSPSSGSSFDVGASITFNGTANDDGSITAYYWTADGIFIGNTSSFTHSFSTAGTKTINLTVTDDNGVNRSATADITIKTKSIIPPSRGGGGGGGGGGTQTGSGGISTIFSGKSILTEKDLIEIVEFFRHSTRNKFSFDTNAAPLVSAYASKGEVVMLERLTRYLESTVKGFTDNLHTKEDLDVYEESANFIFEKNPGFVDLVITRGDLYVDSLAAAPFAHLIGAPILLVRPNEIPQTHYQILEKMEGKGRIYIIGGSEAVSESVEEELSGYASKVIRVGGKTRYETSVEIARQILQLTESPLVISLSGKDPVLYAATWAVEYRAPIVYLDTPPVKESTFKEHSAIEGEVQVLTFDSAGLQVVSDKHPVASMTFDLANPDIIDSWMYVRMRGYDTEPEKWIVRLNDDVIAYNVHTKPVATYGTGQFVRLDVGDYLIKVGENTLTIEGTSFNLDDQFYLTGATLVNVVNAPDKRTEYWIKEGFDSTTYEEPMFRNPQKANLYALYLKASETSSLYFNGERLHPATRTGNFFTMMEADVSDRISSENSFESRSISLESPNPISILTVEADGLQVSEEKEKEKLDTHQESVLNFISEKFDIAGLMYYQDTLEG
jgi:hypothetical protein